MRAYLIDPAARSVTPVTRNGDWRQINELIGCDTFTSVCLENGDVVYVDDEGLLKEPTDFFLIEGCTPPLAGKGLLVGTDDADPTATEEWLRDNLDFGQPMKVGSVLMFWGDRHRLTLT